MSTRPPHLPALLAPLLACFAGCGGGGDPTPTAAFSHPLLVEANAYEGETPEGATLLTPAAFAAHLDRGEAVLLRQSAVQEELAGVAGRESEALARARTTFANDPRMLPLLDALPLPDGDGHQRLPDGSVLYRGIREDAATGRAERLFVLRGMGPGLEDAVEAKRRFETAQNQHGMYAQMFPVLPASYVSNEQLPDPSEIENESYETLRDLNLRVGRDWEQLVGEPDPPGRPVGYPLSWRDEEGVDWRSDRDTPLDVYPTGIWQDAEFPLKWCATHVRDQGRRGTDLAFSVTAAIEARYAARESRWRNLSEQMLYNQALGFWAGHYWENSFSVYWLLDQMVDRGYIYSLESTWDYNRSLFREVLPLRYVRSCWVDAVGTPYGGEYCSDSAHQSPIVYTRVERREYHAYLDPAETGSYGAYGSILGFLEIFGGTESWPDAEPERLLGIVKSGLARKVPYVLHFMVPASFVEATDRDGIVPLDPPGSLARILPAFHSMVLLGYVPNDSLPPGTPPGAGGGYFIAKNSFGIAWGDAGYCYLSDEWVLRFLVSIFAVG